MEFFPKQISFMSQFIMGQRIRVIWPYITITTPKSLGLSEARDTISPKFARSGIARFCTMAEMERMV